MVSLESKFYLGLPQDPDELLTNGTFEDVAGDDFASWTENTAAGAEMLTDGGLENVTAGEFDDWPGYKKGSATITAETVEVHGGTYSVKFTNGTPSGDYAYIVNRFTATEGELYHVVVWVKGEYYLRITNKTGSLKDTLYSGSAADWTKIEYDWVAEWTDAQLVLHANDASGSNYYDDCSVIEERALIEDEGTIVHGGSHAVKFTGGPVTTADIYQSAACTAEARITLSFWSKGDGTNGLEFEIYDNTNAAVIYSGNAPISTSWKKTSYVFTSPSACVSVKVTFSAKDPGPFYLDDVELQEYDAVVYQDVTDDVLPRPTPTWEYGIKGNNPMSLVATTGIASLVLDNKDGEYSPDGGSKLVGFEEGMPLKIVQHGVVPVWTQKFDEEIADFDSTNPAWDAEVGAVADFDSETDADGDLNDSTDAAHDGSNGLEITFDDANVAYGTINATAANQTSGNLSFWFNYNDVGLSSGKYIILFQLKDGGNTTHWDGYIQNVSGTIKLLCRYRTDAALTNCGSFVELGDGWNKIDVHFKASSGAGANDGFMYWYINEVLAGSATGIDNDTRDYDKLYIGMRGTDEATFGGSLYLDTIKLDTVGGPHIDILSAQTGEYGLTVPIMDDSTARCCKFSDPSAEEGLTAKCSFDPNSLTMANNDEFYIMYCPEVYITLKYSSGEYKVYAECINDAVGVETTSEYTLTDENHILKLEWRASPGPGQDDGLLRLYIDGVLKEEIADIDNDTSSIDKFQFGQMGNVDAGTYGIIRFDNCKWGPLGNTKFIGTIATISPTSGEFDDPVTELTAVDWIGYLNDQEIGIQAIQSDKRADEALTTLLTEFPNQPESTNFGTGVETFETVFAGDSEASSMAAQFAKLARNEQGRIFCEGDGTLVFEEQGARAANTTSAFTLDGTMSNIHVDYDVGNIYNIVSLTLRTTTVDAAATTELFNVGQGIKVLSGQEITLICPYTDPDTGQKVGASAVVTPVAAPHFGSTRTPASDDLHADLNDHNYSVGGASVSVDIENTGGSTGYLNEFIILGKRIKEYDAVRIERRDGESINQVGNRRYTNRMDLLEDAATVEDIADDILTKYAGSHINNCRVIVCANIDDDLAKELIQAEPSTRFTAIETATGIEKDFYINRLRYKQDYTLLWVEIEAEEA